MGGGGGVRGERLREERASGTHVIQFRSRPNQICPHQADRSPQPLR